MELKSSFFTGEGVNLIGGNIGSFILMYLVLTGDSSVNTDELMAAARSAEDIAAVLKSANSIELNSELISVGKLGVILWFLRSIYVNFINSRTSLKKTLLGETK